MPLPRSYHAAGPFAPRRCAAIALMHSHVHAPPLRSRCSAPALSLPRRAPMSLPDPTLSVHRCRPPSSHAPARPALSHAPAPPLLRSCPAAAPPLHHHIPSKLGNHYAISTLRLQCRHATIAPLYYHARVPPPPQDSHVPGPALRYRYAAIARLDSQELAPLLRRHCTDTILTLRGHWSNVLSCHCSACTPPLPRTHRAATPSLPHRVLTSLRRPYAAPAPLLPRHGPTVV
jgi:hypothetical protein